MKLIIPTIWGSPQEFISAVKWGYLYQGQLYTWQKQRRGTPGLGLQPATFVTFLQNHDQVANSAQRPALPCTHQSWLLQGADGLNVA